jgi:hypothetical protein
MADKMHTLKMKVTVDSTEAEAFMARWEALAVPPREIGSRLASTIGGALLMLLGIAWHFIEQRTEQACLEAGNEPALCRTTLGDHF